jgi:alkylation response protein AidB-like acyl-CoA dehydrogenase
VDFGICELTEEQKQIKALMRDFCKKEVNVKQMRELSDKAAISRTIEELRSYQPLELTDKLHDVGLRQLAVPVQYGGGGADFMTRIIACEEAGYSGGVIAGILSSTWMDCANFAYAPTMTQAQRDWYFNQFMENHHLFSAGATSEPNGSADILYGYDGDGEVMLTHAKKEGKEWVINGHKMFSSGGGVADIILITTRTNKSAPLPKALTLFWVRKDTPGMTMEMNRMVSENIAGNVQTHLENVRVPEEHLIGEVNKGFEILQHCAAVRMLPMMVALGSAQKMYENMRDYTKERVQGGKPLIKHFNIDALLGEVGVGLEAARALSRRGAWEYDQCEKAGRPKNIFWTEAVRYYIKKVTWRMCEISSDIYGGIVGSVEMPVESFVRRTFRTLHTGGTTDMNLIQSGIEYDNR